MLTFVVLLHSLESSKMYSMTLLAIQLNEPEDGVAPTDSRLRPDQRLMEDGRWDEANHVKGVLEESQRARRRERERLAQDAKDEGRDFVMHEPVWFKMSKDPITGNPVHIYHGEYWTSKARQDWSRSPTNIFTLDNDS